MIGGVLGAHSTIFTARRIYITRCLSVRPSVTLVYCVKTTELIIKQLALDCSLGTLVYGHQTWNMLTSLGDPSSEALNHSRYQRYQRYL